VRCERREARLESYRTDVTSAVRQAGEQAALSFDRNWSDEAFEVLERLAVDGIEFTADYLIELFGVPDSAGAVGAVFSKAAKAGLIKVVGYATSRRIGRHGSLVRVWRGRVDD
jgi:hypothetical protein